MFFLNDNMKYYEDTLYGYRRGLYNIPVGETNFNTNLKQLSEISKTKYHITEKDIGCVFRLKKDAKIFCIDIQENIIFVDDEGTFVKLTNLICGDNNHFFGTVVEPNMYGCLNKCDITFSYNSIDFSETYENVDKFNSTKRPFLWIDLIPSSIDREKNKKRKKKHKHGKKTNTKEN